VIPAGDGDMREQISARNQAALPSAALARNDPGLLVRIDPPLAMTWRGDPDRRCAKEAPVLDLPPLVPA